MGGVRNALHRCLLIIFGVANFMEGASVIADPVVAPMLRSVGLMTLELAGIIVTFHWLHIQLYELEVSATWLAAGLAVGA